MNYVKTLYVFSFELYLRNCNKLHRLFRNFFLPTTITKIIKLQKVKRPPIIPLSRRNCSEIFGPVTEMLGELCDCITRSLQSFAQDNFVPSAIQA